MAAVYDNVFSYIDGKLLKENTKVTIAGEPDDQIVDTTVQGFSGVSPTAKRLKITLENVSPPTGDEVPWFKRYFETTEVEVKLQKGATGEKLTTKGFIQSPSTSAGVSTTTSTSVTIVCAPAWWE